MAYRILTINPGSTSTKIAYFEGGTLISLKNIYHEPSELAEYKTIIEQHCFRNRVVGSYLEQEKIDISRLDAVVGRGGLLRPIHGGTYKVDDEMLSDLSNAKYGEHASNLGAVIANEIAKKAGTAAYVVNPVVVDEMEQVARFSGLKGIERKSAFHALNQKAVAIRAAKELKKEYRSLSLIVAHMGGGVTVGAHLNGRVIDVNNGLEEGAFSPERTGGLPVMQLAELCFKRGHSFDDVKKMLVGKGGVVSYTGTSNCELLSKKASEGDLAAASILDAMAYQVSKEIGAMCAVLEGRVDAVVLTGGLAHSSRITEYIKQKIKFIAKVLVYPGEDEMHAMEEGVRRVLDSEEPLLYYKEK